MPKKLLFLGGSFFQLSPIFYAKKEGHHVITCDYLPNNPGHQYADEYYNISTTDKEEVYKLAKRLKIDGIVAFGSDPSASTAAYVANKLNLPGNPFESVCILTHKDLYREFLRENQFSVPQFASFFNLEEALQYFKCLKKIAIIKPVDSSGSKGVSKVIDEEQLSDAFNYALSFSRIKKVIIEECIDKKGYQIAGDGFIVDGQLVFRCFAQEHFGKSGNSFVPIGESFPLQLPEDIQSKIHNEISRLMSLLKMKAGALNFDIMLNENQDVFLMEIGPRAGGNLISEVIKYSTGVDLAKYVVNAAIGLDCSDLNMYNSAAPYASYMLHSKADGIFEEIEIDSTIQDNIIDMKVFVTKGIGIEKFKNSSNTLGYLILKFKSAEEMLIKMDSIDSNFKIKVI